MSRTCASMLLCLGLAACGGGGGDSTPTLALPVITSDSYVSVAREALVSSQYLAGSTDLFGSAFAGAQASGPQVLVGFATAQLPKTSVWISSARRQLTGVVQSQSFTCPGGGTMSVEVNDANNNSRLDAGDSFKLSMNNCASDSNVIDGVIELALTSVSGDVSTEIFALGAVMSFSNLRAATATTSTTGNGSMTVELTSRALNDYSMTLTLPSLSTTTVYGGSTATLTLTDFSLSESVTPSDTGFMTAVSVGGRFTASALGNKSVVVTTTGPFVMLSNQQYPDSGQLIVTDSRDRKVRITVSGATSVFIEADADANSTYELSVTKQWSELI